MIVIDDFSQYTWTFPLRLKSDVNLLCAIFIHICLISSTYPSNAYNVTMVMNFTTMCFAHSSPPRDVYFICLVLIHLPKTARLNAAFGPSMTSCARFCFNLILAHHIGSRLFILQHICLIVVLSTFKLRMRHYFSSHQTTLT
jgi:hypothetical protein